LRLEVEDKELVAGALAADIRQPATVGRPFRAVVAPAFRGLHRLGVRSEGAPADLAPVAALVAVSPGELVGDPLTRGIDADVVALFGQRHLGRLLVDLGSELDLAAALEDAEAAAEVELDLVLAGEVGRDVGVTQGVAAARTFPALHLRREGAEDRLVHGAEA